MAVDRLEFRRLVIALDDEAVEGALAADDGQTVRNRFVPDVERVVALGAAQEVDVFKADRHADAFDPVRAGIGQDHVAVGAFSVDVVHVPVGVQAAAIRKVAAGDDELVAPAVAVDLQHRQVTCPAGLLEEALGVDDDDVGPLPADDLDVRIHRDRVPAGEGLRDLAPGGIERAHRPLGPVGDRVYAEDALLIAKGVHHRHGEVGREEQPWLERLDDKLSASCAGAPVPGNNAL
ncbi:hypothetical protein GCM10011392_27790 [Wenxinia marina]|nr:hypothetical protein GCM10011392_27790 [Wenxinia marina]